MKKQNLSASEFVNLKDVRNELKNAKTPCAVVKTLYIYAEDENAKNLRALLPAKKQDAIDLIKAVCAANNVGQTRVINRKDGTQREQIIRFSADMFIRFLTKTQNDGARAIEKAAKAARREEEKRKRDAKKAAEKAEKDAKRAAKEAAKAKREETAAKHVQVMKARTIEDKKNASAKKTNAKKNGKK